MRIDRKWEPAVGPDSAGAEVLAAKHGLPFDSRLLDLFELTMCRGTRDLLPDYDEARFLEARQETTRLGKEIKAKAKKALQAVEKLRTATAQFGETTDYNPTLLEAVFVVDAGPPTELRYPAAIAPIARFSSDVVEFEALLQPLLDLPLRPPREKKAIGHITLRKAVTAARKFWLEQRRTWDDNALDHVEPDDGLDTLGHPAAHFVADLLIMTGFAFRPFELRRVWRPRTVKAAKPT